MIKYKDGEMISVLPPILSSEPDIAAISYAYKMAMSKIIDLSATVSLYANIDQMDEDILDLMALEFRTQYYDENLPIEVKRRLVKNALGWYQKAGTLGAVRDLMQTVFGEGDIVEWFDYADPPYTPGTFEIETGARITEELIAYFTNLIHRVKNARSHIRRITIARTVTMAERSGAGVVSKPDRTILNHQSRDEPAWQGGNIFAGAALVCEPELYIIGSNIASEHDIAMAERSGAGVVTERKNNL